MAEFAGLGYYVEIPGVIFDVQRTGPSTGLPRALAGRPELHRGPLARRYQARHAASRLGEGVLRAGIEAFDLAAPSPPPTPPPPPPRPPPPPPHPPPQSSCRPLLSSSPDLDLGMNYGMVGAL